MIRIGTRASALARAQADRVRAALEAAGHKTDVVMFQTRGDQILDRALDQVGGKGLFTTELENALVRGDIDVAVHSLKDLPTRLADGLKIVAYALPEDGRDVLLADGRTLAELPDGARIGTSSLRRAAFLRHLRPDFEILPVRGNLQTRVRKWREAGWDGLVLAAAGVIRLGWQSLISEYLDPWTFVPAPGQGVLAVQMATGHKEWSVVAALDDPAARRRVEAERAVLATLEGGCQVPMGAWAVETAPDWLAVVAQVGSRDGVRMIRQVAEGPAQEATSLGRGLGQALLDQGARRLMEE